MLTAFGTELTRALRFYLGLFCVFLEHIIIPKRRVVVEGEGAEESQEKVWQPFEKKRESGQRKGRGSGKASSERNDSGRDREMGGQRLL